MDVRIEDDDSDTPATEDVTVDLAVSPNPVNEGGFVTLSATLGEALDTDVTVPVTFTAVSAESGDYGVVTGVTTAAGDTTGSQQVSTTSDADTDDEVVTVVTRLTFVTSPRGVSVPTVNLSASPTTVREGASTTLTDGDDEPGPPGIDVTIPLSVTAGTAESGDYTSPIGIGIGIGIRKGETSGTGTLTANQDGDTDDETLTIGFGTLPGGMTAGGMASVALTIREDDTVTVTSSPSRTGWPTGSPWGPGIPVSGTLETAVTIPLTLRRGTAESGDYSALTSITMEAGKTTGSGVITTNRDADTDHESFP